MVIVQRVRNGFVLIAAVAALGSLPAGRESAQGEAAQLKALTTEFTSHRAAAAGRGTTAPLTTQDQANADAAWADAYQARLRALKREQGTAFSLPAFHAYVLRSGAMTLSVLELHMACFGHERHAG